MDCCDAPLFVYCNERTRNPQMMIMMMMINPILSLRSPRLYSWTDNAVLVCATIADSVFNLHSEIYI